MPLAPVDVPPELAGLRIAVLVSGGVAAYKVADLVSQLVQAGTRVRVAMTAAATRFVGPATFQAVSGHPVQTTIWPSDGPAEPHVELGDWAQAVLLAPATANTVARLAQGLAGDLVAATVLAARCPVVVAPAMNDAMWAKPAVQANVAALRAQGMTVIEPEAGRMASGHVGAGRLPGHAALLEGLAAAVRERYDLAGRTVVVSAGGTREPIDPVRYVGNRSSGKMGAALAAAAARRGAAVTLVTTAPGADAPGVEEVPVETALEMLEALRGAAGGADLLVMAAAVADFRPVEPAAGKIRRDGQDELYLRLEPNPDILAEIASRRRSGRPYLVGFAAEGADFEERGLEKLRRKGIDALVANDITRPGIAFASDHNAGVLLFSDGARVELPRMTKSEMADRILDQVRSRLDGTG